MRIAIICPSKDTTCGIGNFSRSLVNALGGKADVLYTNEMNEKMLEFKPDIVNIQWEYALYDARKITSDLNILKKKGIRTNITLHGFSDYDIKNRIIESMFDEYIVLNEGFRQHLITRGIKKPVHVIPLGMQGYEFNKYDRVLARDLLGIGQNEIVVGAFGFLELYKNFHTIIEALASIRGIMFLLCSYSKEANNEYGLELHRTAANLGVKYKHLSGYMDIDSVIKVLHACDAVAYPYVDVFTNSSSAAIRTGICSLSPVIASDITFFDDIPDISKGGPVYKVRDGLVDAINKVLLEEPVRKSLVDNARTFIKLNSWENIADQYLKALAQANV